MKKPVMKKMQKVQKKVQTVRIPEPKVKLAAPAAPTVPVANNFKVRPLADRVLIKEDIESKEQKTASGIIIPVSAQEEKAGRRGVVIATGEGRVEEGKVIPLTVKTGDKVLFQWGDKIQVDNEEYFIVRESEILAIIK